METMSEEVSVWDPHSGSADGATRQQWRRNRNAAYRQAYEEREGKPHPASKSGEPKADIKELLKQTEPPVGMNWNDFGVLWDLHPEHPFTPVLRKRSVEDEWKLKNLDIGDEGSNE